ncbi:hypothetical protein [Reyranella sp.]|uniref:hypothetical protein n=1 Tax=Reyranella sp. TaxID=1929291 RepID=UPI003D109819
MAIDVPLWPPGILTPAQASVDPVAFTRKGGRSLAGLQLATTTDRGYWAAAYKGVALSGKQQRRQWNLTRQRLGGMAGVIAIPAWSFDSAPWLPGTVRGKFLTPHSDGSPFSDGSLYSQAGIVVELVNAAEIGDTSVTLRLVYGIDDLGGVRFSHDHALYETGMVTDVDGDEWTVDVFPDVRAPIPAGVQLEFDMPTVLVHLATDREMDLTLSRGTLDKADVSFIEAVDYWADLAG